MRRRGRACGYNNTGRWSISLKDKSFKPAKGMVIAMAKIYLRKILNGDMTLEDVPERWQSAVAQLIAAAAENGEE